MVTFRLKKLKLWLLFPHKNILLCSLIEAYNWSYSFSFEYALNLRDSMDQKVVISRPRRGFRRRNSTDFTIVSDALSELASLELTLKFNDCCWANWALCGAYFPEVVDDIWKCRVPIWTSDKLAWIDNYAGWLRTNIYNRIHMIMGKPFYEL